VTAAVSRLPEPRKPRKKATPAAARKAEATGDGYVTVEQCGMELRIPVGDNVPFEATLRFMGLHDDLTPLGPNENAELLGTMLLLGPKQWAAFLAKKPSMGDFNAIGDQLQALSGN
jgi:hypothetical protein